ncbi:unnamed protein product [Cylicocyclus nassatus]|uniref:Uncharacterized protein n=1 Tax=Cylicocyclus nassatus TaxID=53992 RepID=A0AA36M5D6_CYLNA|nr:unnamed protein product [Cylicocyclus nassatus]
MIYNGEMPPNLHELRPLLNRALSSLLSEIFELVKSFIFFCLLTVKMFWPQRYTTIMHARGGGLNLLLLERAKLRSEDDEFVYLWSGFACFYYALLTVTVVKNIADYQTNENHRHRNPFAIPDAPRYPQVVILPAEPELGNTNPDDPPPYSAIAHSGNGVETAKEETQPPNYSDLEASPNNIPEFPTANQRNVSNGTVVIGRK